jgi:hypothetical protein
VPIDVNDLTIARHNIINEYLDLPPARGDYLRYAILFNLLNEGQKEQQGKGALEEKGQGLNFESICQLLGQ